MNDLKQRELKRRVNRSLYSVDPERVAAAVIVRLLSEDASQSSPPDGPSPAGGGVYPLRPAA